MLAVKNPLKSLSEKTLFMLAYLPLCTGDTAQYQNVKGGGIFFEKICKKNLFQWVRHAYGMPRVPDKDSAFPD